MAKDTDIAWAAGLWEGEGCWNVTRREGRKPNVQARLAMTDRDVVERFAEIVGFGSLRFDINRSASHPQWKRMHEWYTQRRDTAKSMIEMFWPYLGERRRAKAQELLDLGPAQPMNQRTICPNGHPYSGDNLGSEPIMRNGKTYFARRCKLCRQEQARARARKRLNIPPERWRVTA